MICPALVPILINTYCCEAFLFTGGQTIFSNEGTTQGDSLTMDMYAIETLSLITQLHSIVQKCWYADDSAGGGGDILSLKQWWDLLQALGPHYGYFLNGAKSYLIVKEGAEGIAREVFSGSDIHITTEGHHYLGGVIGTEDFEQYCLQQKIQERILDIQKLSTIAESQLHAAYSAYCHGLSFR